MPKYRKKKLCRGIRKEVGSVFRYLARHKEWEVVEEPLMPDHVHLWLAAPPKDAVSQVVGDIKGKSAIDIARTVEGRKRNFTG